MSVPDISMIVERKVTAIGKEMKSRAVRGSRALKSAETRVLRGQKSGRVYKKSYKKTHYTASTPGEVPAVRSGTLWRSFNPVGKTTGGGPLSVEISIESNLHYAGYLEHGTSKMAARPYVEKIKQEALSEVTSIFGAPYNV